MIEMSENIRSNAKRFWIFCRLKSKSRLLPAVMSTCALPDALKHAFVVPIHILDYCSPIWSPAKCQAYSIVRKSTTPRYEVYF